MATSTSSKLDVINQVLLNVGERSLPATTGFPTAIKAEGCLKAAINEIGMSCDWQFLKQLVSATAWVDHRATVPAHTKILNVYCALGSGGSRRNIIPQTSIDQFLTNDVSPLQGLNTTPMYWAVENESIALFHPYPNTTQDRARIQFLILVPINLPQFDSSTFNVPEEFLQLIVYKTTTLFATAHTGEIDIARTYEGLYQQMETKARTFYRGVVDGQQNMFRRRISRQTL